MLDVVVKAVVAIGRSFLVDLVAMVVVGVEIDVVWKNVVVSV